MAIRRHQRGMRPLLYEPPRLDDKDAVRVDDCRQPMSDHESRAALHQRFKRALNQGFALGVEG